MFRLLVALLALTFVSSAQIGTINTVAGNGSYPVVTGDGGPATSAGIGGPGGVTVDAFGNIFIADIINGRIRKVDTSGIITTYAGGGFSLLGDGGPAIDAFLALIGSYHVGLVTDPAGNLYFADSGHSRIRKVDTSGIITTVAGNGSIGFSGDGGAATSAELNTPSAVALDAAGNLYICDTGNGRIRKVDTSGTISTVVGTGNGFTLGDGGPATSAQLANPVDVAVDPAGNIYIADLGNNKVRKVTNGIITSILSELFGNCSAAPLPAAQSDVGTAVGLAFDAAGNLYIADHSMYCIHQLNTSGMVTTVAGGGQNEPGDGGPATSAQLGQLDDVATDGAGNFYIADDGFSRIQKVSSGPVTLPVISQGGVANAASFSTSIAPGSIVAVFGTFPISAPALSTFPLPTSVSGVSLEFGTAPRAPLFYGGSNQINAQVPWELAGETQTSVSAALDGVANAPQTITLAASAPGIFIVNSTTAQGAILDANYQLVTTANRAVKGSYVQIYCTGLGAVTNQPATGAPAPSSPLAATVTTPVVTMGGAASTVYFSGLVPGEVGLYQINASVPEGAASGTAEPLTVSMGGTTSNTAMMAIQ